MPNFAMTLLKAVSNGFSIQIQKNNEYQLVDHDASE
jgi:hypothetical protein